MANLMGKKSHQSQCDCNLWNKTHKDWGCRPKKAQRQREKRFWRKDQS